MIDSTFTWATVTQLSPLRVRLAGDAAALLLTPQTLIDPAALAVGTRVRVELTADQRINVHGSAGGDPRIPTALALGRRNLIRNARFRINQRGWASGGSVAANAFFLDGWKSAYASATTSWTATGDDVAGRVLTNGTSGRPLRQVIERADVVPGDYIAGHYGTMGMRVYNVGATAPSYTVAPHDAPFVVTLDGSADVIVEFERFSSTRTIDRPYLVRADRWGGYFPDDALDDDLRKCQRYYYRTPAMAANGRLSVAGFQTGTALAEATFILPVAMRAAPTVGVNACWWTDGIAFNVAISSLSLPAGVAYPVGPTIMTYVGFAASGAGRYPGVVSAQGTTSYAEFTAEL